ncbi:unnamed protein product [Boreogadus saida]
MEMLRRMFRNMVSVKVREYVKDYCRRNGLLTLSVFAVVTGCVLGFFLRSFNLSTQAKIYFSFPGELLMRMLKMLILPLITSSLMSGLSAMDTKASGRLGVLTITYYLWTTFIAVIVGIVLVLIIHPGTGSEKESGHHGGSGPVMTSADALLDLIRNMIPSNLIEATFQQYRTDLIPIVQADSGKESQANYVYVMPDYHNPQLGHPVFLEITPAPNIKYKIIPGNSKGMNVLGIVIFSATMGLLLGKMGERGAPLVNVCQCINECVMKIINAAMCHRGHTREAPPTAERPRPRPRGPAHGREAPPTAETPGGPCGDLHHGAPHIHTPGIELAAVCIGAAGIPQAGLVTMVIVLTSVGLPPADITLIVAIDWVLDRFRTMINVLGDALAAGIMAHLCKKDFEKAAVAAAAAATANTTVGPNRRDTAISFGNQSVTMSEAPLMSHRCDYVYEVDRDQVMERPLACYNLCQV